MYAFHYMSADETLIFRYDNAPHFPKLLSAPYHKHVGENDVIAALQLHPQKAAQEVEAHPISEAGKV